MTSVLAPKQLTIVHTSGLLSPWTLSPTFLGSVTMTRCKWSSIGFSKMAHFVPCSKTISREDTTQLFLKNVVWLHSFPEDVTSDRGPQFISHFWRWLLQTFGTSVNLSSAHHPQTYGQTERVNQILEQYLLVYSQLPTRRLGWLPCHGGICL